jgi:hypothetical protein
MHVIRSDLKGSRMARLVYYLVGIHGQANAMSFLRSVSELLIILRDYLTFVFLLLGLSNPATWCRNQLGFSLFHV